MSFRPKDEEPPLLHAPPVMPTLHAPPVMPTLLRSLGPTPLHTGAAAAVMTSTSAPSPPLGIYGAAGLASAALSKTAPSSSRHAGSMLSNGSNAALVAGGVAAAAGAGAAAYTRMRAPVVYMHSTDASDMTVRLRFLCEVAKKDDQPIKLFLNFGSNNRKFERVTVPRTNALTFGSVKLVTDSFGTLTGTSFNADSDIPKPAHAALTTVTITLQKNAQPDAKAIEDMLKDADAFGDKMIRAVNPRTLEIMATIIKHHLQRPMDTK